MPSKTFNDYAQKANAGMISFFESETPKLIQNNPPQVSDEDIHNYMDHGYLNTIKHLYAAEELSFIKDIGERFPRVKLGFAYFSLLEPASRPLEAKRLSNYQKRTGWQKITGLDINFNQNVEAHNQNTKTLALALFPNDPEIDLIAGACEYHDTGEAVIGDFTPTCPITREEKTLIEQLGIRLATKECLETIPLAKNISEANQVLESNDPKHAKAQQKVKDCDLLDMPVEALRIMLHCSNEEAPQVNKDLQAFWNHAGKKVTTDEGKTFFEELAKHRYKKIRNKAEFNKITRDATIRVIKDKNLALFVEKTPSILPFI